MNKTQKLTATAMLVALSVVANAFSIQVSGSNYISFTYIPCFIAAMYLGIIPSAAVGFLGDLIAGLLFPKGAYNILIGLASMLTAVIPATAYKLFPKYRKVDLFVSLLLCTIICTSGLNTYALWLVYGAKNGKTFWVYLWARLPFQLINTVVNGILIWILQASRVVDKLFSALAKRNENNCACVARADYTIKTAKISIDQAVGKTTVLVAPNLGDRDVEICVEHRKVSKTSVEHNTDGSLTVKIDT